MSTKLHVTQASLGLGTSQFVTETDLRTGLVNTLTSTLNNILLTIKEKTIIMTKTLSLLIKLSKPL